MFNIVEKKKIFMSGSALVIVAGLIAFFAMGFNADVDFTGGYTMSVKVVTEGDADLTADAADTKDDTSKDENKTDADADTKADDTNKDANTDANKDTSADTDKTADTTAKADGTTTDTAKSADTTDDAEDNGLIKTQLVKSEKTAPLKTYEFSEDDVRKTVDAVAKVKASSVVKSEDGFVIKTNELDAKQASDVKQALADKYGVIKVISEDKVSATVGSELLGSSLQALLIAAVLMLIYISFRFELLSGLSAVLALVHDVLIMLSMYAIFRLPVNTSFIAAMLTIIGYSINATIVIFDRIRENTKYLKKETFSNIVNTSIWQSMGRSINTTVTTLLTIVMVYILGVTSVREFALPIIIGLLCGTYSSIFLAGSFWCLFRGKKADAKVK
ncbi:protein translocase subunit SecF [Qingrenia yutianensis]|uniref:Protein-export membrane protein SecF n=1 Tax=Qingrenia yutianensis TaxID=2763676 RepID=A0A926F6I8_9FIRM|nr:protein translocase subunit SecF [Qingrenia yutianensis]MBC8596703.1 protein translocase subunit SecF [Qingrenia yutianensis]